MDKKMSDQEEASLRQLEEMVAHLIRVTDDLSEVVARQDTQINLLQRRVQMLMQSTAEQQLGEGGSIPLADQRPPHW